MLFFVILLIKTDFIKFKLYFLLLQPNTGIWSILLSNSFCYFITRILKSSSLQDLLLTIYITIFLFLQSCSPNKLHWIKFITFNYFFERWLKIKKNKTITSWKKVSFSTLIHSWISPSHFQALIRWQFIYIYIYIYIYINIYIYVIMKTICYHNGFVQTHALMHLGTWCMIILCSSYFCVSWIPYDIYIYNIYIYIYTYIHTQLFDSCDRQLNSVLAIIKS